MPFDDPHTCTPNLWCYRVTEELGFEVSAAEFEGPKAHRLGLECFALWQYRLEQGESTLCNFGRFHSEHSKSKNRKSGVRGDRISGQTAQARSLNCYQFRGPLPSDGSLLPRSTK
jgi:hypothetical protein